MKRLVVDPGSPEGPALDLAAEILRGGGLVAFPTETVYGLGANALDEEAVRKIFAAKGRPSYNPLIAHVADVDAARALAASWPVLADRLAERFWPGPLTLVVPKRPEVPDVVTAGLPSVAVRVPAHPVAHALLQRVRLPVAAPSANRFTQLSPTTAEHVAKGLGDRVDLILDGGPTSVGIESTVIDLTGSSPVLLRPGSLALSELQAVTGPLLSAAEIAGDAPRPSPGMVRRHYSPRATLRIFGSSERERMVEEAGRALSLGRRVGALLLRPGDLGVQHAVIMPDDPAEYAQRLYDTLHQLDDLGCELILVDAVPEGAEWMGVRDRLARAAHQE